MISTLTFLFIMYIFVLFMFLLWGDMYTFWVLLLLVPFRREALVQVIKDLSFPY